MTPIDSLELGIEGSPRWFLVGNFDPESQYFCLNYPNFLLFMAFTGFSTSFVAPLAAPCNSWEEKCGLKGNSSGDGSSIASNLAGIDSTDATLGMGEWQKWKPPQPNPKI
ncbi:hypothetical protein [Lyngbya aestuarii]|uniref:hypothetical protein n=1 Tax=Lyngbya aestuarii TaxID=118322 RepID=UPI00403E34D1